MTNRNQKNIIKTKTSNFKAHGHCQNPRTLSYPILPKPCKPVDNEPRTILSLYNRVRQIKTEIGERHHQTLTQNRKNIWSLLNGHSGPPFTKSPLTPFSSLLFENSNKLRQKEKMEIKMNLHTKRCYSSLYHHAEEVSEFCRASHAKKMGQKTATHTLA